MSPPYVLTSNLSHAGEGVGGGWSALLPVPGYVTDGTAAAAVTCSLFFFPLDATAALPGWLGARLRAFTNHRTATATNVKVLEQGGRADIPPMELTRPLSSLAGPFAFTSDDDKDVVAGYRGRILDESSLAEVPWDVVLLMGGKVFNTHIRAILYGIRLIKASCVPITICVSANDHVRRVALKHVKFRIIYQSSTKKQGEAPSISECKVKT